MTKHRSIRSLRLLPVNRIAALKLRGAGMGENGEMQPVFQLMAWGIDRAGLRRYRDLSHELEALASGDQGHAVNFLLEHVPGGLGMLLKSLIGADPWTAAGMLLGVLDMRLKTVPYTIYRETPIITRSCGGDKIER